MLDCNNYQNSYEGDPSQVATTYTLNLFTYKIQISSMPALQWPQGTVIWTWSTMNASTLPSTCEHKCRTHQFWAAYKWSSHYYIIFQLVVGIIRFIFHKCMCEGFKVHQPNYCLSSQESNVNPNSLRNASNNASNTRSPSCDSAHKHRPEGGRSLQTRHTDYDRIFAHPCIVASVQLERVEL